MFSTRFFIYSFLTFLSLFSFSCSQYGNPNIPEQISGNTVLSLSDDIFIPLPDDINLSDERILQFINTSKMDLNFNCSEISSDNYHPDYQSALAKNLASSKDFIVTVWDGALNDGKIMEAFNSATEIANGWSSYKGYYIESGNSPSDVKDNIEYKVTEYGKPKSQLNLLIIGKSMGGAKTYKMSHSYYDNFNDFNKVALVLVDPHEPIAPGDKGRADYWYDYVHFRRHSGWNDNYDLTFTDNHSKYNSILAIFSTYQRSYWPRGYKFTTNSKQLIQQSCDHNEIANSSITVNMIKNAIEYLVN